MTTARAHRYAAALGAALLLALAGAASAQTVGSVSSQLAGTHAHAQQLSGSIGRLEQVIGQLSRSIALVEQRSAAVQGQLAADRATLATVTTQLRSERQTAISAQLRFADARTALSNLLVSTYETDGPDAIDIVITADGLADLLDRLEFLRFTREREKAVIVNAAATHAAAQQAATRLSQLETRDAAITSAVAAQARAVAAMDALLSSRRAALQTARDAQAAALHSARARGAQLQKLLNHLEAQQGTAYGNWAIPAAIVMCESGGQDLPPNSAGASGYYQFMPATWRGLGGSTPNAYQAPKSEQDRLAAKLWNGGAGAGNWVCAGIVGIH